MSRIQRVPTKQGHYVPARAHAPNGPFPAELYSSQPVVTDYIPIESGGPELPEGATAQNNYKPPKPKRWFRCSDCDELLPESALDAHECDE